MARIRPRVLLGVAVVFLVAGLCWPVIESELLRLAAASHPAGPHLQPAPQPSRSTRLSLLMSNVPSSSSSPTPSVRPTASTTPRPGASAVATRPPASPLDRTGVQWQPFLEWTLANASFSGNPFDLIATTTFTHTASGTTITTGMFYTGARSWSFRFTGTLPGEWVFRTSSADPDLHARRGRVTIAPNPEGRGFITGFGEKWGLSGSGEVYVPRLLMYGGPSGYAASPAKIDADIQTFLVGHGFNGFHSQVFCEFFELGNRDCSMIASADPNPDPRTFEALELLITRTHAAGGTVHLWMWGDDERGLNMKRWGINGPQDLRLQRYLAARLGPIPGWSAGYGFDLWEWVTGAELATWHAHLQGQLGWHHPLGARANKDQLDQLAESLDYSAYEQMRPDYADLVAAISARPQKPTFSEDRFRIREDTENIRHFEPHELRRVMWQAAMAGGVAAIYGNLTNGGKAETGSAVFPNATQLQTHARFLRDRFVRDLERCPTRSDGACLARADKTGFLFYKEDATSIGLDLSGMPGPRRALAVDALRPYAEIDLGLLGPAAQTWTPPYPSDWAIAVGDFS